MILIRKVVASRNQERRALVSAIVTMTLLMKTVIRLFTLILMHTTCTYLRVRSVSCAFVCVLE